MSNKIEVKICDAEHYSYINWFSEKNDISDVDAEVFMSKFETYYFDENESLLSLANKLWKSVPDGDRFKYDRMWYIENNVYSIIRTFYLSSRFVFTISPARKLRKLALFSPLILYYTEERKSRVDLRVGRPNRQLASMYVRYTLGSFVESFSRIPPGLLRAVVVSNLEEGKELSCFLRRRHHSLLKKNELYVLENPKGRGDLAYWQAQFPHTQEYEIQNIIGHTDFMPYSQDELDREIPPELQIKKFPCLVFLGDLPENHIILDIPEQEWSKFFETVFHTKQKVLDQCSKELGDWDFNRFKEMFLEQLPS